MLKTEAMVAEKPEQKEGSDNARRRHERHGLPKSGLFNAKSTIRQRKVRAFFVLLFNESMVNHEVDVAT